MAGSPIKRARREIAENAALRAAHEYLKASSVDAAILQAYEEGKDPALLLLPAAKALHDQAVAGDVAAIRELFDRVSGKVAQEVIQDEGQLEESLEAVLTRISEKRKLALSAPRQTDEPVALPEKQVDGEVVE